MPCGGSPFGNVCVCDIIRRRGEVGVVGVVSEHQALLLTRRETTLILAKQHCGLYRHSSRPSIMGILEVGNLPRPRRALLCLGRPLAPASGFRRRGMVDRCAGGCTRGKTHDHHLAIGGARRNNRVVIVLDTMAPNWDFMKVQGV